MIVRSLTRRPHSSHGYATPLPCLIRHPFFTKIVPSGLLPPWGRVSSTPSHRSTRGPSNQYVGSARILLGTGGSGQRAGSQGRRRSAGREGTESATSVEATRPSKGSSGGTSPGEFSETPGEGRESLATSPVSIKGPSSTRQVDGCEEAFEDKIGCGKRSAKGEGSSGGRVVVGAVTGTGCEEVVLEVLVMGEAFTVARKPAGEYST